MTAVPASLSIVVPLYDEEAGVPALAEALGEFAEAERTRRRVQLVLVDDGSRDRTAALLREHFPPDVDTTVVAHPHNLGLGAALETGSRVAEGDYVAWLDSDLTYSPAIVGLLAARLDEGADVAFASCYHPDGGVDGVPGWRLALSRAASSVYRALTGRRLHTYTSMVRAWRKDALAKCAPRFGGFLAVTETALRAVRGGHRCAEVPAVLARRRVGQSKMRIFRVALGHVALVLGLVTGRFDGPTGLGNPPEAA